MNDINEFTFMAFYICNKLLRNLFIYLIYICICVCSCFVRHSYSVVMVMDFWLIYGFCLEFRPFSHIFEITTELSSSEIGDAISALFTSSSCL